MTDAEVICEFMEPMPTKGPFDFRPWRGVSPGGWWAAVPTHTEPICPDSTPNEWHSIIKARPEIERLGLLREVEARLTEEQRIHYLKRLVPESISGWTELWDAAHASADQKIKALASVLKEAANG